MIVVKDPAKIQNVKRVWSPLKGSQTLSLSCPANVILNDGTRGPGKTDAQLLRFRARVGMGYGHYWRGVIFDREYKNLDDLVSKSMRWFPSIDPEGSKPRFLSSKADYRWRWSTGEELLFRVVKRPSDYWSYHGQEFPFIGWNELTKYPTDELFEMLMSCNRSSFRPEDHPLWYDGEMWDAHSVFMEVAPDYPDARKWLLPEIPLEVFATTNPHGPGHNWVKKRFISVAPPGKLVRRTTNVFNPRTQRREDVVKTQVRLFGSYRENKYLSPEYIAELENLTDKNKRKAWLGGSWDITAGGMFDDQWDSDYHIVTPFRIPESWSIDRAFDWGSSKPFSVGWWAESDGSDVQLPNGQWRSTVKGDLFRIAEWYGWTGKPNQGLRMLAIDVAAGIIERELAMGLYTRVKPGPADNSIWDTENGNSIAADMARRVKIGDKVYNGVQWRRSDKSPGSRKHGWEQLRTRLHNALPQFARDKTGKLILDKEGRPIRIPREAPGLFVFQTCKMFIDLFPSLPRDEDDQDDVDTDSEDHIGDEARYEVLDKRLGAKGGRTKGT